MAKFKKKPRLGKLPSPGDWDQIERSPVEAIAKAESIISKLKNAPGAAWDKSFNFFTDVETRVKEMRDTLVIRQKVTEGQERALTNWEKAIDRMIATAAPGYRSSYAADAAEDHAGGFDFQHQDPVGDDDEFE